MRETVDRTDVLISENPERQRFEAHVDGELVGIIDYVPRAGTVVARHTEVFDGHEGQGVASILVRGMIEQLRRDGRRLRSRCPYVSGYLARHPEETDVVDPPAAP